MHKLMPLAFAALLIGTSGGAKPSASGTFAQKEQVRLDRALAGKSVGKPRSCITLHTVDSSSTYGESTILYKMSNRLTYRNDPPGGCPGLGRGALITRTPTSQLCRGDIAVVRDISAGFDYGSCVMGDFIPYMTQ